MTFDKKLELIPDVIIGIFLSAIFIVIVYSVINTHKYTIIAQDRTYKVDTFRVYGGQLNFDDGDKNIIVKGNYIIEINR